jgi:GNAT superfamily N-acetyltransferase
MTVLISQITDQDIEGAITCIQAAFASDPYNHWVFDRANFSVQRNRLSLGLRCQWGKKYALFHVAKDLASTDPDKVVGVACWMPPVPQSAPQSWSAWYGEWKLWVQQGAMNLSHGRGGLNITRYRIWKAAQAEAQAALWKDEAGYYFCNIVTVLPEMQGQGIGKLLIKRVTDVADKEGRKCYLESSRREPNMMIYERMGFRLVREMVCDDDGVGITLYCMMR